ncbi:MAG TPA: methyltransferase domain-containing protein [Desulfuromonadales bacterium]|jgi:SAM-dependent methyltransferase
MSGSDKVYKTVQEYYGTILQGKKDLRSNACCSGESLPNAQRRILAQIDDEILDKFYGCGSPIPPVLEGCTLLDLGCGSGRDAYLASALVGPQGRVIGVDMTAEQLAVARRHRESQASRFGLSQPNVEFHQGYIEDLAALGIADSSVDVVISNCVINLSPQKERVFSEILRVLKPGGELYFSDVFSGRRVPPALQDDPLLRGECLGGALYIEDFRRLLGSLGCRDYRVISKRPVTIANPEIEARVGAIDFYSLTVRVFRLPQLEDICEDYGQVAIYRGTIPDHPHHFVLDDHHTFQTGRPMLVCGNTAAMVGATRFAPHFQVIGDTRVHYGPFDCRPAGGGEAGGGRCC